MTRTVALRETRLDTTKAAIAMAMSQTKDLYESRAWAVGRWGEAGAPTVIEKDSSASAISALDTGSTTGLSDRELFRAIRERALLPRLQGLRRTAFRTRSTTISNSLASWVAEAKPIPVLKPSVTNVGLIPAKLAGLSVWTKEALAAVPGIERLVFEDLVSAVADGLDLAFLDPTNDGTAVAPKSVTYNSTEVAATANLDDDLAEIFAAFSGDLRSAYFLTCPQVAAGLATEFVGHDLGARGGTLCGIPVLTSNAAPDARLTLIDPASIMAAWDETIDLQTSEHGDVEMADSGFTQDQPTGSVLVSMWQSNLVAIRAIGRFAWAAAGPSAAVTLTGLYPNAS